jgi:4-amino-4-deoxy-L-arabinose transferase-like glycosyltransferase
MLASAIAAVLLGAWCIGRVTPLFHQDTCHYLSLAASLAHGGGYHSTINLFPDSIQPPVYPLLVAAGIKLGAAPLAAARAVCLGAHATIAMSIVWLHGMLWGRRGQLFAAALGATCPALALCNGLDSEPVFIAASMLAFCVAAIAVRRGSLPAAGATGLLIGTALLTRPEALLVGGVLAGRMIFAGPRRAGLLSALLAGVALLAVPYGLWMRSQTGQFELTPKLRYNRTLASIMKGLPAEPGRASEMRVVHALMPDHATFVLDYAFRHPDFDPRPVFPRQDRGFGPRARALASHAREMLSDGMREAVMFHPLPLALLLLGAWRGLRRGRPPGERWWTVALLATFVLLLVPSLVAGDAYERRFLASAVVFSLPLVACGALALLELLERRLGPRRFFEGALAALLVLGYGVATAREASRVAGGPALIARAAAISDACRQLPAGARVLADHAVCGYLAQGFSIQLPYAAEPRELFDYLAVHRPGYAMLDGRTLRKNPSPVDHALLDPAHWPPGWRQLSTATPEGGDPFWIVALP